MIRRPPRSTRTDTLFPYTTLFRSAGKGIAQARGFQVDARLDLDPFQPRRVEVDRRRPQDRRRPRAGNIADRFAAINRHHIDEILRRSEEHTSELQSLMRISYAVFCLKKKTQHNKPNSITQKK